MGATEDFYREKAVAVYESRNVVTDVASGEIISESSTIKTRTSSEPDFVKLYYKTMMSVHGIDDIPLGFMLGLAEAILYAGSGEDHRILFFNNKTTRSKIASICGVADNMVSKYIARSVKLGVLFKTDDRGTYEVNPWLIAKGRWEHIRKLQASFDFVEGHWVRTIVEDAGDGEGQ